MQRKASTWVVVAVVVALVIVGGLFLMLRRPSKAVDVGAAEREKLLEMEKRVLEGNGQATTAQPPR
jgi:flagellar basal body-associated protein FliL